MSSRLASLTSAVIFVATMGHRCNYALRDHGEVTVYYSHWGALSILRDFFWGLASAKSFLAQQDIAESDGWLDDVWGEGGAAIDLDTKTITIDEGQLSGPARALALDIMREIWSHDGFTVKEAASFVDIATAVGVPADVAECDHTPDAPLDASDDVATCRDDGQFRTVVSIDGVMRFLGAGLAVLELGADRLGELARLPDYDEAYTRWDASEKPDWEDEKKSLFERIDDVIVIDTTAKRLDCKAYEIRNGKVLRYYEAKWPGWKIVPYSYADTNAVRARVGVPSLPDDERPQPSLEDQLGQLERYLFSEAKDTGAWFREISATLIAEPGGWVNPHALRPTHDGRPDDAIDANAKFRAALQTVLARRRSKQGPT